MIECVLEALARHGVTDAVLSLGYLPDRFTEAYPADVISGVRVTYAVESEPLDTAGAIRFAAGELRRRRRDLSGRQWRCRDDLDVTKLLEFHRYHGGGSHDCAASRWRTLALWRGADVAETDGSCLRGEAAARRSADQSDQRRHLRLRAPGARPHRSRPAESAWNARPSPHWPRPRELFAMADDAVLARHGHAAARISKPTSTS